MQNMRTHMILALALGLIAALGGCKKYEQNGSLLHLRSPEKRLLGTWTAVRVQEVGVDADTNVTELLGSNNLRLTAEFRDDNSATLTNIGEELVYEGSWAFNDDKSVLHLDVTFLKPTGPFFIADDTTDLTEDVLGMLGTLMTPDTFLFEAGTLVDITEATRPFVEQLMNDFTQWTYTGGSPFFDYATGDDVSASMGDFINDLLGEGIIESADDFEGIIAGMADEYGVNVTYSEVDAAISGWNDPTLTDALMEVYGISADLLIGAIASGADDEAVLTWYADNMNITLVRTYSEVEKALDIYWKVLELELDDLQAYQFREYNEESIYDYSYLLRFEQTAD